jgi:hypothetical protein
MDFPTSDGNRVSTIQIQDIDHVVLRVRSLERMVDFY